MSLLRDRRVIIASLFLPTTAALSNNKSESTSKPSYTPEEPAVNPLLSPFPASSRPDTKTPFTPVRSVIDDLTNKSKVVTPVATPRTNDSLNPFAASFKSFAATLSSLKETEPMSLSSPLTSKEKKARDHGLHVQPAGTINHLREAPVPTWHLEPNPQANGGLSNAVNSVSGTLKRKVWVGALSTASDTFDPLDKRGVEARLRRECDSIPVWIDDKEFSGCYDIFCHQVLWPCFHYSIPDAPKSKVFNERGSYALYEACNRKFADTIIKNYQEGDIVWINDYHLMLVPAMVRAALPSAIIGFFLHVAFPSSEVFRCLAVREQLLNGLLAADLIGFQTANFARYFRQTVNRILSLETVPRGITTREGKFVDVAVFPMGIDVGYLNMKRKDIDVAEWVHLLKERYDGMKLIVGWDKLDEVPGVKHKLLAFEVFLSRFPEFQGKVILIQVALSTGEESEIFAGLADLVSRINSRFSTLTYQPVVFLHTQETVFSQYLALLTVADAFIVTSLREGMALRTHEYVECQDRRERPLILSEFTGSYSYTGFRSCIAVNPWDSKMTAEAIHQALTMSDEEASSRWKDLHRHVVTQTAQAFVTSFLTRCVRVNLEQQQRDPSSIPLLDVDALLPRYKHSSMRTLLLDLEGTLCSHKHTQNDFELPKEATEILRKLDADPRNRVWLLSGLPRAALDKVATAVSSIGLVAENGCFIKPRPARGKPQEWINLIANYNMTWKSPCLEILRYYTERTPGSFLEAHEASIIWHFWTEENENHGDRQWARRQASEAQNHLWDSLGELYSLRIIPEQDSFLVIPNNISRSTAVGTILHPAGLNCSIPTSWFAPEMSVSDAAQHVDIMLCVGADEKLLRRMNELDNAETCTTSGKRSNAKWRLPVDQVIQTLGKFASLSNA